MTAVLKIKLTVDITRAVDPVPHGSAFILPPGSGSSGYIFRGKMKNTRKLVIIVLLFIKIKQTFKKFVRLAQDPDSAGSGSAKNECRSTALFITDSYRY